MAVQEYYTFNFKFNDKEVRLKKYMFYTYLSYSIVLRKK